MALATVATVAVGAWGLAARSGGPAEAVGVGEPVAVPGGLLRVDRVRVHTEPHQMPGMAADRVPAGHVRLTVEISLLARSSGGLRYPAERFSVSGDGMEPVGSHLHQLGSEVLQPGTAASGSLTFQVPRRARRLALGFDGARDSVRLPLGAQGTDGHDHDDHHHGPGDRPH